MGGTVLTHGDGSITVQNGGFQTYNKDNGLLTDSGHVSDILANNGASVAGIDGTLYANYRVANPGTGGTASAGFGAYKNGAAIWKYAFSAPCQARGAPDYPYAYNPAVGYDGNILVILSWICQNSVLAKISASDGSLIWSQSLDTNVSNVNVDNRLWVIPGGGARVLDGQTLKTYSANGELSTNTQNLNLTPNELIGPIGSNSQGDVYIEVLNQDSSCPQQYISRIARLTASGTSSEIPLDLSSCRARNPLSVTPAGGVILFNGYTIDSIGLNGTVLYSVDAASWSGHNGVWASAPVIDGNGNAFFQRSGRQTSGEHDIVARIDKVSPVGVVEQVFDSTALTANGNWFENVSLNFNQLSQLANGELYFTFCNACSPSIPAQLYRIDVAGLTMDYPRNAVFGNLSQKLNYVALGDFGRGKS
jgi:hypothetical protein